MYLPYLKASKVKRRQQQVRFGGYNHNESAQDGELYDMKNITSDLLPVLSARSKRHKIASITKANGIYGRDVLCWVDGTKFLYNGVEKGTVSDSQKSFCSLREYIIILPDKKYYNTATDTFGSLEATYISAARQILFTDGTIFGVAAVGCCLNTTGAAFPFNVGDAVAISGCTTIPANNKSAIIREISTDKKTLTFDENAFTTGTEATAVTVARSVPDMDFLVENENRLWGSKGDLIYSCKLGDPFNWNVYDDLSTDSYAVPVGSAGDFTGSVAFLGYPIIFKAANIYKMYGSKPSNFKYMGSATTGVAEGSSKSLAIAGEKLFYLSDNGVQVYSGGIPQSIHEAFGTQRFKNGVAGSDGQKYYISMQDETGAWHLFVFDTQRNTWHREDGSHAVGFAKTDNLYMMTSDSIYIVGRAASIPAGATAEARVEWNAEFTDFVDGLPYKKIPSRLILRADLDDGAFMDISIQYDSSGKWEAIETLKADVKRSYHIPISPRRCDHYRLKISGEGDFKLYSLTRELFEGGN